MREREKGKQKKPFFFFVYMPSNVTSDCRLTKPASVMGIAASRLVFLPKTLRSGSTNYKNCRILAHCSWLAEHVFFVELGSNIEVIHVNILE